MKVSAVDAVSAVDMTDVELIANDLNQAAYVAREALISKAEEIKQTYWDWWKVVNREILTAISQGDQTKKTGRITPRIRTDKGKVIIFWEKRPRIAFGSPGSPKRSYATYIAPTQRRGYTKTQLANICQSWEWQAVWDAELKFQQVRELLDINNETLKSLRGYFKKTQSS
ncbi:MULTISPECIES: conjugative transfer protein MobI(A/C) [Colwellia]|uniref:Uncharacterized protein n=1 Tax=Colwellia marinimaniae TaxID=1513592 RepID=A0ABQ0MZ54_9GAMM|nr:MULTISPECIES: conjugative transfer protein MobI(A/C) [Colwellia]GAW97625.1 hypothetical protein MTCD1_03263 [Colwellia marinimaniae]